MMLPVALGIATLSSNHGTEQFLEFFSTLKKLEASLRDGTFFEANVGTCLPPTGGPAGTHTTSRSSSPDEQTSLSSSDPNNLPLPLNDSEGAPTETRFQLAFKKKVKARGRPKRASKQLSFKKTSADRKTKRKPPPANDVYNEPKRRKYTPDIDESEDDDSDDGKPTCLVCYVKITGANRSTVTFTKCCSMKVHTACLQEDGCPRCDDFGDEFEEP